MDWRKRAGSPSSLFVTWKAGETKGQAAPAVEAWIPKGASALARTWDFSQTLAAPRWTEPGGVLVPVYLADDQSVLAWTPPDGEPHVLPPDRPLDVVFQELLSVPPGFGQVPSSVPAKQPTTQAKIQSATP